MSGVSPQEGSGEHPDLRACIPPHPEHSWNVRWRQGRADSLICYEEGRGRKVGRGVGQAVNCSSKTLPQQERP